jgi:hypothetical protein
MRELTRDELSFVSGGNWDILTSPTQVAQASRFAASLSMTYGAFQVGYAFGSWLYNNGLGSAWNKFLDSRMAK